MAQQAADIAAGREKSGATDFFLVSDYDSRGQFVLVMGGPGWTPTMRKHYGVAEGLKPFFSRACLPGESPDRTGHPWGRAYRPSDLMKDESRYLPKDTSASLGLALEQALQASLIGSAP